MWPTADWGGKNGRGRDVDWGASAGASGLSLSAVATRLWICPGHMAHPLSPHGAGKQNRTEQSRTEPIRAELNWTAVVVAAWNFAISLGFRNCFFYFSQPCAGGNFSSPPRRLVLGVRRPIANSPAQDLGFSAISPLWGCGKDSAQRGAVLALLASDSLRATPWVAGQRRKRRRGKNRSRKMTFVGFRNFHCTRNWKFSNSCLHFSPHHPLGPLFIALYQAEMEFMWW